MLMAELADMLDLDGFEGQVVSLVGNTLTSRFFTNAGNYVAALAGGQAPPLTALTQGFDLSGLGPSFGSALGSALATVLLKPEAPQVAIFASAAGAIGAAIGGLLNFVIPGLGQLIGSFLGTLVATWAGNSVVDNDALAQATIGVDAASGVLGIADTILWEGGNLALAQSLATSTINTVNDLLAKIDARPDPTENLNVHLGHYVDTNNHNYVFAHGFTGQDLLYQNLNNPNIRDDQALARVATKGIEEVFKQLDIVGADPIVHRAFHASKSGEFAQLAFDLRVAQDYRVYLDNKEAINALILAARGDDSLKSFAGGWIATLARVEELKLNEASIHDFKGGIGEHLLHRGLAERHDWLPIFNRETPDRVLLRDPTGLQADYTISNAFGPGYLATHAGTAGNDALYLFNDPARRTVVHVSGGEGNDTVVGTLSTDLIIGGAGADSLDGFTGNDWLHGGDGGDLLVGNEGDDYLSGAGGNDVLSGGSGADMLVGGAGNDMITIGAGEVADTVVAATVGAFVQDDRIILNGIASSQVKFDQLGSDLAVIKGLWTAENRSIILPDGTDGFETVLVFRPATSTDLGGAGRVRVKDFFLTPHSVDQFQFSDGTVRTGSEVWNLVLPDAVQHLTTGALTQSETRFQFDGGNQHQWTSYKAEFKHGSLVRETSVNDDHSVQISLHDPAGHHSWRLQTAHHDASGNLVSVSQENDDGTSITTSFDFAKTQTWNSYFVQRDSAGSILRIVYFNDDGSRAWYGSNSGDAINGTELVDLIFGGGGNDQIAGYGAGDWLDGQTENDIIWGGTGADNLFGGVGDDTMYGQEDNDQLYGQDGADWLEGNDGADLLNGADGADVLSGGAGADYIAAGAGDDYLTGGDGDDWMSGDAGTDTLFGGLGNDQLFGAGAADFLDGGAGNDFLAGGEHADTIVGGDGGDQLFGEAGADFLHGDAGHDALVGGEGSDRLMGGDDNDTMQGEAGNDTVAGEAGADLLFGGTGDDDLSGGAGDDQLFGGMGIDKLTGGAGVDAFAFGSSGEGYDIIADFNATTDLISLSSLGFGLSAGHQFGSGTTFITGSSPWSVTTSKTLIYYSSGYLYFDHDGIGSHAPTLIGIFENSVSLNASNFVVF